MKNIIKVFAVAAAVSMATGCIKETSPQSGSASLPQVQNAQGSFESMVSGITSAMIGGCHYSGSGTPYDIGYPSFLIQRDVMGQDIALEDSGSEWYSTWYSCGSLGPTTSYCQFPWTEYYYWINNCNNVISLAGDDPTRASGKGVAYAIRAMSYMDLARMFGVGTYKKNSLTVPIKKEDTSLADTRKNPRADQKTIWAFIMDDLDQAETLLKGYKRPSISTPDVSVVYGMKARAYLTMEDWPNAEKYAKLAQEGYSMMSKDEYTSPKDGFNKPTSSWIWGMSYKSSDTQIIDNDGDTSWGAQMIIEVNDSKCGYAASYGTPKRIDYHLYNSIPDSDFRKTAFVDFSIDKYMDDADAEAENLDKDAAAAVRAAAQKKTIEALEAYSDSPSGLYGTGRATPSLKVGGLAVKFRPKDGEHFDQFKAFTVSVPFMRIEEMKLIEAEAAGMQDLARGKALLTAFATTRDPDYVYGAHEAETYGSSYATPFQNEIWWQRRVELWGEGFGAFDIKRLDKGVIRSYEHSNHIETYSWNVGDYGTNDGCTYPNWMDLVVVQTETNYNPECGSNPMPIRPSKKSALYQW